jgi:hypothetical protein
MQHQGPADNCVIAGRELGWLSCTAYGMAMGSDAATRGGIAPDGCTLRDMTGDISGGLTIPQVSGALRKLGVLIEMHVGLSVCQPSYAAQQLAKDRVVAVQGNTGALLGTPFKDTGGAINHLVLIAARRGGTTDRPEEVLIYDPAADGRAPSIADGPDWWPWDLVLRFAARLHPWGEDDPRVLGPGKWYCAIYPVTPPPKPIPHWAANIAADIKAAYSSTKVAAKLRQVGVTNYGDALNYSDLEAGLRARHMTYGTSVQLIDVRKLMKPGTGP